MKKVPFILFLAQNERKPLSKMKELYHKYVVISSIKEIARTKQNS